MRFKINTLIAIISCLLFGVKCLDPQNNTEINTTTDESLVDNNFDFENFDEQNKVMDMGPNQNCSSNEDCTSKHTVCDLFFNRCECDVNSMQYQYQCKTFICQMNEECVMRFMHSSCVMGRCQCTSGRKHNGKCLRGMGNAFNSQALPDWAIISIAVTLALTVIAGGSLRKKELRSALIRIIRVFLQREENQSDSNSTSSDDKNRNLNNKDIELQTI